MMHALQIGARLLVPGAVTTLLALGGPARAVPAGATDDFLTQANLLPVDGDDAVPTNARVWIDRSDALAGALLEDGQPAGELTSNIVEQGVWDPPPLSPSTAYQVTLTRFSDERTITFVTAVGPDEDAPVPQGEAELVEVCSFFVGCDGSAGPPPGPEQEVETFRARVRLPPVNDASSTLFVVDEVSEVGTRTRSTFYDGLGAYRWVGASPSQPVDVDVVLELVGDSGHKTLLFRALDVADNPAETSLVVDVELVRSADPGGCSAGGHRLGPSGPPTEALVVLLLGAARWSPGRRRRRR